VRRTFANCEVQTAQCPGGWSCSSGACTPPPPPSFSSFTATFPGGTGGSGSYTFETDGHLEARPTLVRAEDSTQLYWNVSSVAGCTVAGTNGDTWSAASSGSSGQTSSPLSSQTTFTLTCQALEGATPTTLTESVLVRIIPVFQEQ
jgi:hypothetical protein